MKNRTWILVLALSITATPFFASAQNKAGADTKPALLPGLDKQLIDSAADPCTNFFQYACGNFPKLYPIPPDQSGYGTGTMVFNYTEYTLHSLLEKVAADHTSPPPNEHKSGD